MLLADGTALDPRRASFLVFCRHSSTTCFNGSAEGPQPNGQAPATCIRGAQRRSPPNIPVSYATRRQTNVAGKRHDHPHGSCSERSAFERVRPPKGQTRMFLRRTALGRAGRPLPGRFSFGRSKVELGRSTGTRAAQKSSKPARKIMNAQQLSIQLNLKNSS